MLGCCHVDHVFVILYTMSAACGYDAMDETCSRLLKDITNIGKLV